MSFVAERFLVFEVRVASRQFVYELSVLDEVFCRSRWNAESPVHSQFLLNRSRGRQPEAHTSRRHHDESRRPNLIRVTDLTADGQPAQRISISV